MYKTAWIDTYNITSNSICHFNMKKNLRRIYQHSAVNIRPHPLKFLIPPPPLKCQNLHFVCNLLAEDPGLTIPSVVAILPVFDEFLPISSKPDHLCRFSCRPTQLIVVLTLCLPPARCGPRPSILSVETILPNFVAFLQISSKLDYLCRLSRNPTPTMPKSPLCLLPASWGPRALDFQHSGNSQISMDLF